MARMARATRKRLGEILMDQGVLDADQVVNALQEQKRTGELLGETLVRLNYATEDDIAACIVMQFGLPFLAVKKYAISDEMTNIFPPRLLMQYQFLPVDRLGRVIAVAAGTLLTPDILSELEQMSGSRIQVYVGRQSEIREVLEAKFAGKERAEAPEEKKLTGLGSMLLGD
jgi:type IV pilus assembly protein PilB